MRKVVFIPVVALAGTPKHYLLELIIEAAEWRLNAQPQFHYLKGHGLKAAIKSAERVMAQVKKRITLWPSRAPLLYLANPFPGLSNTRGATLGIVMGLLMYNGLCNCNRLMVTGIINSTTHTVEPATDLTDELTSAMALGYQEQSLLFIVPILINPDVIVVKRHTELVHRLATLNIRVSPVQTLREAIAACS